MHKNTVKTNPSLLGLVLSIVIINSLFSINANAQGSFFIKPKVKSKIFMSAMVDPNDFNAAKRTLLVRQKVYSPYVYAESFQSMKPISYDIGISLGWASDDKKRMLELSWDGDRAGYKTFSAFKEYNSSTYTLFEPRYERPLNRFSVTYSFEFENKLSFITSRLSLETGLFTNFNTNDDIIVRWIYNTYLEPDVKLISVYHQPFKQKRVMPFISIGLENDLILRNKYIASLKLTVNQGLGTISNIDFVHEYEIDGKLYLSRTGLISRGSGIYLELSRRIQFYPWKKNRD